MSISTGWFFCEICIQVSFSMKKNMLSAEIDRIKKRQIAIATLKDPTNMGDEAQEMKVLALVVAPKINKETKSAKETAQTLATLLTRDELRLRIEESLTSDEVVVPYIMNLCRFPSFNWWMGSLTLNFIFKNQKRRWQEIKKLVLYGLFPSKRCVRADELRLTVLMRM